MSGKRKATHQESARMEEKKPKFWNMSLKTDMNDLSLQVFADDKIIVIKDKYPKAKHHFLVLPRENLPNLKSLKKNHVGLLQHMQTQGKIIADDCQSDAEFRFGYHAVPSLSQIHLHVISQDFVSDRLKTKRHWNSFTTDYFVESDDLIRELRDTGKYTGPTPEESKRLLDQPLRCHRCSSTHATIPKLKQHLLTHLSK